MKTGFFNGLCKLYNGQVYHIIYVQFVTSMTYDVYLYYICHQKLSTGRAQFNGANGFKIEDWGSNRHTVTIFLTNS